MKKLIFLSLFLVSLTSFTSPPVIQGDAKGNWVYELNKKKLTDPATVISATWVQVASRIDVYIECDPVNYNRTISVGANYYHPNFPGTPKYRTFYAYNAVVTANVSAFTVVVYVTGVPNGGYCSGGWVISFS